MAKTQPHAEWRNKCKKLAESLICNTNSINDNNDNNVIIIVNHIEVSNLIGAINSYEDIKSDS